MSPIPLPISSPPAAPQMEDESMTADSDAYVIEQGVPMPSKMAGRGHKYPFQQMEVGDSFLAPLADRSRISSRATITGKRNGLAFSVRKVGSEQIRIWRTA